MAKSPERKWTTLRKIAPLQGEVQPPAAAAPASSPPPAATSFPAAEEHSILVAHPVASTARLIRETLEQFTGAQVFTTGDPLRAFELALQRHYGLFFFAMQVGELSGPLLYELIAKAWSAGRGPRQLAPAVVFVREKDEAKLPEGLERDVRVRAVLNKPIRIERLLESVKGILEVKDPTLRN